MLLSQYPNSEAAKNYNSKDNEGSSRNMKAKWDSAEGAEQKEMFSTFHPSLPRITKQKAERASRTNSQIRQIRNDNCGCEHQRQPPVPALIQRWQQHSGK